MTESTILKWVRLAAAIKGFVTFRNNVGALKDHNGNVVRYGLTNGSSDLIGYRSIVIEQKHVGRKLAVFTAIEVKTLRGKLSKGQEIFLMQVTQAGGIAFIARSEDDVERGLGEWLARQT